MQDNFRITWLKAGADNAWPRWNRVAWYEDLFVKQYEAVHKPGENSITIQKILHHGKKEFKKHIAFQEGLSPTEVSELAREGLEEYS